MNLISKFRTAAYLLAAAVAVGVVIWTESTTWKSVAELRRRAGGFSEDSFHLSSVLEARVLGLGEQVLRFSTAPNSTEATRMAEEGRRFREWLATNRMTPPTAAERDVLRRMDEKLNAWLSQVAAFSAVTNSESAIGIWRESNVREASGLMELTRELASVERLALASHLESSQRDAESLHQKLIGSSLVLMLMGAVLAVLIYRGIIAPLRETLRQSQQVIERQEKLSSLGVLAAGVAHEIRNPLTSIKVRLFTQQQLLQKGSEEFEDNVFLADEITRLETIVKDFLAFARPSEPEFVVIPATQPMRELVPLLQPSLRRTNVELKEEYLADPGIRADIGQLKQVLINLAKNAAEAMPEGGRVVLRTRIERRGRGPRSGNVAVLEVVDSGPGIPPEVACRLFDPFFTTKASGTGLGLSIAARIVEKHGGSLEHSTALRQGTTFRVVLPIEPNHDITKDSGH